MKFNTISKAALMAVLLSATAPVFGAGAGDPVAVAAAHPVRTIPIEFEDDAGSIFSKDVNIDLAPGDKRAAFDKMIALHWQIKAHNPVNVGSDIEELARQHFDEGTLQFNILYGIACMVPRLNEPGTPDDMYSSIAGDIEVAACLFRFYKPGGMVIPGYLPDDEEYVERVLEVISGDQLSKWLEILYVPAA